MIQLVPQMKILLACEPVDFRTRIDGLVSLCRNRLTQDPFSGALFVFRNRSGTSIRILAYDGQGFWLVEKRWSTGRLQWWPKVADTPLHPLPAQHLAVLLYNGIPTAARFASDWRRLA